jgi:hypothetical protein
MLMRRGVQRLLMETGGGQSSWFARTISLFFEELIGVFRPIIRRDFMFLDRLSEGLAQSVKVEGPQLFAFVAVRCRVTRPHGTDDRLHKFRLSRTNA